jgi:Ca2+-binding RTX toxin-like protein
VQNIYTEATARQFFVNKGWNLSDTLANGVIVGENSANILDQSSETTIQNIHGLGGNDTLTGGSVNDIITGGNGNDTLQGNGGADTFKYHFKTAGNDTILDFDTNSDKIDLSILLDGLKLTLSLTPVSPAEVLTFDQPTSLCSYYLMSHAEQRSNKY